MRVKKSEAISMLLTKFEECLAIMKKKEKKYARPGDTLIKFRKEASFLNLTKEEVCMVLLMKHISTLEHAVEAKKNKEEFPREEVGKSCTDAINYLVLFEALYIEGEDFRKWGFMPSSILLKGK